MADAASFETVEVQLSGETVELRPSRRALRALCDKYGGLAGVLQALAQAGEDVQIDVIAAATNASADERRKLPAAIFEAGLFDLISPLSRYVSLLGTGGREQNAQGEQNDDAKESAS